MKKLLAALLCAAGLSAYASTSAATATITDSDGTVWGGCSYSATLVSPNGPPTVGGVAVPSNLQLVKGSCNSSGALSATLLDTSSADQSSVTYTFTIQPNASVPASIITGVTVVGATPSLSTALSNGVTLPRFTAGDNAFGYADVEVRQPWNLGNNYVNTGTVCGRTSLRQYSLAGWACAGSGGGSSTTNPVTTGLVAEYQFLPTESGNASVDYTNNGHTCTWSTSPNAPARSATTGELMLGYSTQYNYCDTGITFSSAVTVVATVSYDMPPGFGTGSGNATGYSTLFSDSAATLQFITSSAGGNSGGLMQVRPGAQTNIGLAGYGQVGWTRATSPTLDTIIINGLSGYRTTGSSGASGSGTLLIGNNQVNNALTPWHLSVHWVDVYSGALTAAQITQVQNWQRQQVELVKGFKFLPQMYASRAANLSCSGDSITYGQGVTTPFCSSTLLTPAGFTATVYNTGLPGDTCANMAFEVPRTSDALFPKFGQSKNLIVFCGTNDLTGKSASGTIVGTTLANLSSIVRQSADRGWNVFVGTMLSRASADDPHRLTYNQQMASLVKTWGGKGLVDFASFAPLGANGANLNPNPTACQGTTCFQGDQTHPTQAGQNLMAGFAANVLQYANSIYSPSNPHLISANYTLTAADQAVSTATGGITATLPDCTALTGYTFTVINNSASAISVLSPSSAQTVNGSDVSVTPVSVAAHSTIRLTPLVPDYTAGGCVWTSSL